MDVIEGDRSLFLRYDEVEWAVADRRPGADALGARRRPRAHLPGGQLGTGAELPPV
jgi:hypothetical protein